jgi:phage repressor protein C with HTH and peptisase S24 domain
MAREIRLANVKRLIEARFDGVDADFARAIEKSPAQVWQFLNGERNIGERLARQIEARLQLPTGALDLPGAGDPAPAAYEPRDVPVVGTAQLGDDGYWNELQYPTGHGEGFVRYPMKDPNTYALRVKGDSMRPRIKPGEFVVIEPNAPVVVGDEVMVQTKDGRSMIKQLGEPPSNHT